ncbi:MAG: copper resistance protein CopC [Lysobacterales bacterium]|nr:MAG: copper resistance protein CopC [Xanthomonadales bacterium]
MKISIVVIALVVLLPSLAHGHAQLASSMPADQASLPSPPKELTLNFSEAVRLTALTVARDGERPRPVGSLPAGMTKDFSVAAPSLAAGHYSVSWRALAADSHVMTGTFTFTVGAASSPAGSAQYAEHARR